MEQAENAWRGMMRMMEPVPSQVGRTGDTVDRKIGGKQRKNTQRTGTYWDSLDATSQVLCFCAPPFLCRGSKWETSALWLATAQMAPSRV